MLQILLNFIFPLYLLAYPEIVMCQAYTNKKFEIWHPRLRGSSHCGTPKNLSNSIVFSYLFIYSENFIVQRM